MTRTSPRALHFLVPMLFFALTVAGCGGDAVDGMAEGDVAVQVEATDLFRVGALDGEDWETFARVDRVRFDAAGNLYIFDRDQSRVIVTDPRGAHLRTVGSRGDGPGQLRMPMLMEVEHDGTVIIGDMGARAYVLYGPDGDWRRSVPFQLDEGFPSPAGLLHPEGGIVNWGTNISINIGGQAAAPPPPGVPVRVTAMDGSGTRTLVQAWAPPRDPGPPATITTGAGGAVRMTRGGGGPPLRAFEPRVQVAVLPDGTVALADSTTYRIRLLDPEGRDVGSATRAIHPQPVEENVRRLEKERRLADLASGATPPPTVVMMGGPGGGGAMSMGGPGWEEGERARIEAMEFWEEIPAIQRLTADWDGRLWVERAAQPGAPGPVDLLDGAGSYHGTIAPSGVRIPSAFGPGGLAAYIERDDFDVPFIRVVRLSGLPEA